MVTDRFNSNSFGSLPEHAVRAAVEYRRERDRKRDPDFSEFHDEFAYNSDGGSSGTKRKSGPELLPFKLFADIDPIISKKWLCSGLLGTGELSALYGVPGSGKSVLAGSLAGHIASGQEWMGRKVRPGTAVIVALERAKLTERRMRAEQLSGKLPKSATLAIINGPLDLCNGKQGAHLLIASLQAIAEKTGLPVEFVLIDTVNQALAGGDENSPKDMGSFVVNVTYIVQESGAHVMLVHHSPADNPQKLRGHTALLGACDTTILVSKAGQHRRAEVIKANDSEEGVAFTFDLESVDLGTDEYGETTTAPVVIPVAVDATLQSEISKTRLSSAQQVGLKALENAIGAEGIVPPASNYIPSNTPTVSVDNWRRRAYEAGISSSDDPEAKRKAFQRVRDALKAKEKVWEHNDQVWIV